MNDVPSSTLERNRRYIVGLRIPQAIKALNATLAQLEQSDSHAGSARNAAAGGVPDARNPTDQDDVADRAAGHDQDIDGYDFTAASEASTRIQSWHFRTTSAHALSRPPGTVHSHLCKALSIEAIHTGKSVYFDMRAEIVAPMVKAEREGNLKHRVDFLARNNLLIVDEIGQLPVGLNRDSLFFRLINPCYERCSIIPTSNRSVGEWGEVFGVSAIATALLGRLLHRVVNEQFRCRRHLGPRCFNERPQKTLLRGRLPSQATRDQVQYLLVHT